MRRLRVLFAGVFLLGIIALGMVASAQEGPPPDGPPPDGPPPSMSSPPESPSEHAAHELTQLSKKLKLSQEQRASIRPILEERATRMQSLFADHAGSPEENMSAASEISRSADAKIRDLLTDDQKARYAKIAREYQARMHPNQD